MKKVFMSLVVFLLVFTITGLSFGAGKYKPGFYTAQFPEAEERPFVAYLTVGEDGKITGLVFDFLWQCKDGDKTYLTSGNLLKEKYGLSTRWCKFKFVKSKPVGEWFEQADALAGAIVKNQGWNKAWTLYYKDWNKDGKNDFIDVLLFDLKNPNGRKEMPDAVSGATIHVEEFVIVWNKVIAQAQEKGGTAGMALSPYGKPYMALGDHPPGFKMPLPLCPWLSTPPSDCK